MKPKFFSLWKLWSALALIAVAAACQKASPTRPSDVASSGTATTSVIDARTGATVTSPAAVSPANNAEIKFGNQPVTLVVANGATTGRTALTYWFEVATDIGFANKVFTKDNVAGGGGGQTSLSIDKLAGGKTYFWRVHSGSADGPASRPRAFAMGPEVILQTPVLGDPAPNATVGASPVLNVNNVQRSGPAGQIFYRFEVSDTSSFSSLADVATVPERSDQSFTAHGVGVTLEEKTYYWRVQASDPSNGVTTGYSSVSAMKVQPFDLRQATIVGTPFDYSSWPVTTTISFLALESDGIRVEFDKKDGPGRWPDVFPPGFSGSIEFTMGLAFKIDGHWYAAAPIEMWHGRDKAGGPPQNYALNWFYDPARWAPLTGHQPPPGELIGFFVVAGDTRAFNSRQRAQERSNVVLVPMPDRNGATFTFSAGRKRR
jgi:hypothetical protein